MYIFLSIYILALRITPERLKQVATPAVHFLRPYLLLTYARNNVFFVHCKKKKNFLCFSFSLHAVRTYLDVFERVYFWTEMQARFLKAIANY